MADDNKEKLKIEAELDTSNLKKDAKQGFSEISKEEKKVQQESKQTSKAIEDIGSSGKRVGQSMQQAGQQSTSALKNISNEAKNATKQVENIAKATKEIKFKQGLGMASNAISQLAPVGQAIGTAAGMSDGDMTLAGAGISGAMSGAMMGSALGPLGAAGGALVGAAASLITAAGELKKAAAEQREQARGQYEANLANFNNYQTGKAWNSKVQGYAQRLTGGDAKTYESTRGELDREIATLQSEIRGREILIRAVNQSATADIEEAKTKYASGKKQDDAVKAIYDAYGAQISEYMGDIRQKESQLAALTNLQKIQPPKTVETPTETAGKESKKHSEQLASNVELSDNREKISSFSKLLSDTEKLGSVKLSDSLTRVGGGTGYGTQMNGIASKVSTITDTLKSILSELKGIKQDESSETVFTN